MKITFIIPGDQELQLKQHQLHQCRVFPPAGLAHMVGAVANIADTHVVDERLASARHAKHSDIAVIFVNSYNQQRAYALCNFYRKQGAYIVLVGQYLEQARFEARRLANTLLVGRGEDTFIRFINDIKAHCVRREYFDKKTCQTSSQNTPGANVLKLAFC